MFALVGRSCPYGRDMKCHSSYRRSRLGVLIFEAMDRTPESHQPAGLDVFEEANAPGQSFDQDTGGEYHFIGAEYRMNELIRT